MANDNIQTGDLPALDKVLLDRVVVNQIDKTVRAADGLKGDSFFATWLSKIRNAGHVFTVVHLPMDEIAKLIKEVGVSRIDTDEEAAMHVKKRAMEILKRAAEYGASDVHFMLRGTHTEIQFVLDGRLKRFDTPTQKEGEMLIRSIFQGLTGSRSKSLDPMARQNGQITGDIFGHEYGISSMRLVRGPCYPSPSGGFMTIRIMYSKRPANNTKLKPLLSPASFPGELKLKRMGYTNAQVEKVRTLMAAPDGIVIFTGPTGSGKTTALSEVMQELSRTSSHRRLVTIEDPVEIPMPWAVQMSVTTDSGDDVETGLAFKDLLRTALRMAPNTILIGEVRGPDVALASIQAAQTGHQVWTTMHINDPFMFMDRLETMHHQKLHRKLFCNQKIIRGIIAQRLLPGLCEHCSIPLKDKLAENKNLFRSELLHALSTWGDLSKIRVTGDGCVHCNGRGTGERFAVAEVVVTDADLMKDLIQHGSEIARENFRKKGESAGRSKPDKPMIESALAYVFIGRVDPSSIEEYIDVIAPRVQRQLPSLKPVVVGQNSTRSVEDYVDITAPRLQKKYTSLKSLG